MAAWPVATAARRHATAGPRARSTQSKWSSVHTEPCHQISASTGAAAASASQAQGHVAASAARAHDAGGRDADREQRGEVGRRLDLERIQARDERAEDPHRRHDERHGGDHDHDAPPAHHQQQHRKRDVQLGLDGHRPERPVGARRTDEVLNQQAVDEHRLRAGRALPRRRDGQPRDRETEAERGPVRREDPPGPPARERKDPVEPPAVAGGRQRQREAGQHDEHDDREPPVDEPRRPERRAVHGVAGECAQEDVIHDHEQRCEAPDAVEAGQPVCRRSGGRASGHAHRATLPPRHDGTPEARNGACAVAHPNLVIPLQADVHT